METQIQPETDIKVLSLEDSVGDYEIICELLIDAGFVLDILRVEKEFEYAALLHNNQYDIVLADFKLPGFDAFGALEIMQKICPEVPFVCVSGSIGEELAVELLKQGATDYVLKDRLGRLPFAVRRALDGANERKAQKSAEEELERNQKCLAEAQRISHVGNWDWDTNHDKVYWSDEMCNIFGVEPGKLRGLDEWFEIIHPDDRELVRLVSASAIKNQKPYEEDCRLIRPDGSTCNIKLMGEFIVDASGKPIRMQGTVQDITKFKEAEAAIQHINGELKRLDTEKDKFFSIIAHDLRGPFNGFLGLTTLMAEDLPNLTRNEIQEMSLTMRDSATNLFGLLENLLEWSRMQIGLKAFIPESFLLMDKIAESLILILPSASSKEITICYDIPADLVVFADGNMFACIIRNLVTNAVKFTPKGGTITVLAKSISGNSVEISINDTGIGMSSAMIENLFRLDVNTSRKGTEGELSTGLGLTISQNFIEKHGGKLWIESIENKGSTFYFTLPITHNSLT